MRLMRKEAAAKRSTIYTESMETFHRAADLIGMHPRVRL